MPDNTGFVVAAYAVTAICLAGYWRFLCRREKDFRRRGPGR